MRKRFLFFIAFFIFWKTFDLSDNSKTRIYDYCMNPVLKRVLSKILGVQFHILRHKRAVQSYFHCKKQNDYYFNRNRR